MDPDLANISNAISFTNCAGAQVTGTLDLLSYQGSIKSGVTIGGVTGTLGDDILLPDTGQVREAVNFGVPGSLTTGTKPQMKICRNKPGYANGVPEGTAYTGGYNGYNSLDGSQFGQTFSSWHTTNDQDTCDERNFIEVTGMENLVPDDVLRLAASGQVAWTNIYQDQLSGLYFTNQLALGDIPTGMTWSEGLALCSGLNGGSAGSGWELPSLKQLMQLYINGISKHDIVSILSGSYNWSATTSANNVLNAHRFGLASGAILVGTKTADDFLVICVKN